MKIGNFAAPKNLYALIGKRLEEPGQSKSGPVDIRYGNLSVKTATAIDATKIK